MSTKRFCDFCGGEIPHGDGPTELIAEARVRKTVGGTIDVQVTISLDFGDLDPDICTACIFTCARKIDPNPVAGEPA